MRVITADAFASTIVGNNEVLRDVRRTRDYSIEHISGAISRPLSKFKEYTQEALKHKTIYVYCNTGVHSKKFSALAQEQGINIINIRDGIVGRKQKHPAERVKHTLPLMQQVHMIAGSLIVLGVLLSRFSGSIGYILISGAVGTGLFVAGATGFCGMAQLLSLAPRNK